MLNVPCRDKIRYLILLLTIVSLIVILSINCTQKNISQKTPPPIEKYSKNVTQIIKIEKKNFFARFFEKLFSKKKKV